MLYKMLEGGPIGLIWLDLSFNCITTLDSDVRHTHYPYPIGEPKLGHQGSEHG